MQDSSPVAGPPPVFVGGTGRSGTTIVGELIGASDAYALVPIELRFHVDKGGLGDLVRGAVSVEQFELSMLTQWYIRPPNSSGPRGAHVIIDRPQLDEALARLRERHQVDPWTAAGAFLDDVIQPLRRSRNAESWVEMTPPTAKQGHLLARMLPSAKFIHMVRDGRDVASSVARRSWGPNDMPSAVTWWGNQMKAISRATRGIEPSRLLTLRLESLVGEHRDAAYGQVVQFLGLDADEQMRTFFETTMSQGMSHAGRWRSGLSEEQQQEVEALYGDQLARLERAGTPMPPVV